MVSRTSQPLMCNCIVTVDSDKAPILLEKTVPVSKDDFSKAVHLANRLLLAIQPLLPAAGLAAPQIGENLSVFVFSPNRKDFKVAINPSYKPIGDAKLRGWEGCFSTMETKNGFQVANVERYEEIEANYQNSNGETVTERISGFAAKVFQHEMDHLDGILNINRPEAEVKRFNTQSELKAFMDGVKKEDSKRYQNS